MGERVEMRHAKDFRRLARRDGGRPRGVVAALAVLLLAGACAPLPPRPSPAPVREPEPARLVMPPALIFTSPDSVSMDPRIVQRLDSIVETAIAEGAAPGAAIAVGRHGRLVHMRGYGRRSADAQAGEVGERTIWDLASLTKVAATTIAAMMLEEEGRLVLDRPVASYLPALDDSAKAGITVRMLLTHTGGLEAFAPLYQQISGREAYLQAINTRPLRAPPGTRTEYSDWDMILLQLVIEAISGETLDAFAARRIFRPLGMVDTGFTPPAALRGRIAPTEVDRSRGGLIHGQVHDPNAWAMGGVAGHAGLFSSARDMAVLAQMLLNGGSYAGVRILSPQTIARWTAPQVAGSSRALGWDTPSGTSSAGRYFSPRSFGHTGFTGTSLWIDPERGLFVILLANRVYYTSSNQRHVPLRRAVADAAQAAILDAPLIDWESRR